MEHIKTPVTVDDETLWLRDADGRFVVAGSDRINDIARAINAHDALVAALTQARVYVQHEADSLINEGHSCGPDAMCDCDCSARLSNLQDLRMIDAAIKLAKGGE